MADFMSIVAVVLVTLFMNLLLKQSKMPVISTVVALVVGAYVLLEIFPYIRYVFEIFTELASQTSLNNLYLDIILKVLAVSYVAEFVSSLCKDAGEGSLAGKVDFSAKVVVMVLATPIIVNILDSVVSILP